MGFMAKSSSVFCRTLRHVLCEVIQQLNTEESAFIEEIKQLISKSGMENEITFIFLNFDYIHEAITKLNSTDLSLK